MSSSGGNSDPSYPSVLPEFAADINSMRTFANSQGGQTVPTGAFTPQPGTMGAANLGNSFFSPGGTGSIGTGAINNILSGNNLTPGSNPYLSQNITALQQAFGQTLGSGMDKINSSFAGSGQSADSGPRANTTAQFGRNSMSDFSNSLNNMLFGNYNNAQNQLTQTLGMMNTPLTGAGEAGALSQGPGQLQYQGQQAQNSLNSLPFQYLLQLMGAAPVAYPQYQQSSPSWWEAPLAGLGSGIGQGAGMGLTKAAFA